MKVESYEAIMESLNSRQPLPPLFPQRVWDAGLSQRIAALQESGPVRAGLLLWNDDLDASHSISQGIETPTGSYWHALMHRREGDIGNSHYWWRRTGPHPAYAGVQSAVLNVLEDHNDAEAFAAKLRRAGTWLPDDFADLCALSRRGGAATAWLEAAQVAEFAALLDWCRNTQ